MTQDHEPVKPDLNAAVGRAVRARRKAKGMTLAGVAAAVGISTNYVGLLERGARKWAVDLLGRVAPVLGAAPSALLADSEAAVTRIGDLLAERGDVS